MGGWLVNILLISNLIFYDGTIFFGVSFFQLLFLKNVNLILSCNYIQAYYDDLWNKIIQEELLNGNVFLNNWNSKFMLNFTSKKNNLGNIIFNFRIGIGWNTDITSLLAKYEKLKTLVSIYILDLYTLVELIVMFGALQFPYLSYLYVYFFVSVIESLSVIFVLLVDFPTSHDNNCYHY